MKVLIYSDVHGNLPAFEKMIIDAGKCDCYICLGDLVNYGPWSNECVELALTLTNSIILKGNHEDAFIVGSYNGSNSLVKEFFDLTFDGFNKIDIIESFSDNCEIDNYFCQHTLFNKYIYPDTELVLDKNYIIGHSHHQFIIKNNGFQLINTGSVGQNRKYINVANYLLYDTENKEFKLKYFKFDVQLVIDKMIENHYTENCILYYKQKQLF